ncbi:Ig-like domain-containing protein [Pseudoalteromonas viridis]|uniref:Cadherin-like domain-containing protein n=1 Tax=Pseudoalteromonas viridis TaxID=339617 RepID=A0ABX7UZU3_9GAMM|nr:Ig-like domain-containing protein [Pseudoalteromonas viridis]QTL34148.1 cadherin-like domain-containing protein [Pseudoalteromonas viridis]
MKRTSYGLTALSTCAVLLVSTANAAPQLDRAIFEYNAGLLIQEEFNLFADGNVSDPDYPNSTLRIQLNSAKSYEQIGFYDQMNTTYGQAVAYNTLDRRWLKFKGKLLYFSGESDGSRKVDVIRFRVINPANEASPWAEVRVSLDHAFDIDYDVYPSDDTAQTSRNQPVEIFVKANDVDVPYYYGVEIFSRPQHGSVSVNSDYSVTYTPAAGYTGQDSFQYRIKGNNLYDVTSAVATVSVQVAQ